MKAADNDWVRVVSGNRICYWDGGAVGVGKRRFRNCGRLEGGADGERARMLAEAKRGAN